MGDVSPHFNRTEFSCKCGCGFNAVDIELLGILESVRTHFDRPVAINSACRCPAHNKNIGGASKSQHMQGIAADIVVQGIGPDKVADYLEEYYPQKGIGRYASFTHIDVRGCAARWNG